MATPVDFKKLKVPELKDELLKRGLSTSGAKAALLERLESHIAEEGKEAATTAVASDPATESEAPQAAVPAVNGAKTKDSVTETAKAEASPPVATQKPSSPELSQQKGLTGTVSPAATSAKQPQPENGKSSEVPPGDTEPADVDKKKKRAERFGVAVTLTEEEKRKLRADRFKQAGGEQVSTENGGKRPAGAQKVDLASPESEAKKKARAERFGLVYAVPSAGPKSTAAAPAAASGKLSAEEEERRKKRAEKFGTDSASSGKAAATATGSEEEERRRKRAERFALASGAKAAPVAGGEDAKPDADKSPQLLSPPAWPSR